MKTTLEDEHRRLRLACSEATRCLSDAAEGLRKLLKDKALISEAPRDVRTAMEATVEAIGKSLRGIHAAFPTDKPTVPAKGEGPTRQQGQFLAFIHEYTLRNSEAVAPSYADFQRFFNLTPPSVNSMLIRLEQRGFIRREPGKARAIEVVVNPDWIPPLERPFKF
jgi:predicted Rossmann fold nucleotide-binding protein DprA/Smf involved in DNA uptake